MQKASAWGRKEKRNNLSPETKANESRSSEFMLLQASLD